MHTNSTRLLPIKSVICTHAAAGPLVVRLAQSLPSELKFENKINNLNYIIIFDLSDLPISYLPTYFLPT